MTSNVKLEPMAYVTMLKHLKKNQLDMKANLAPGEKHEEDSSPMLIYGFLLGFVEEDVCTITEYVPIMSVDKEIDFEVLHKMFHIADRVNEDRYDPEYISEQIVGWVHSSEKDSVQYNQLDIKNQIYIQTAYNANAVLLLLPCSGDQYSMEFRSFRDKIYEIDETSPFSEIDWNFKDVDDIDEVFQTVVDIYRWKYRKSPILKEFTEILEENEEDE